MPEESTSQEDNNRRGSFKLPALDMTTTARGSIKNETASKSNRNSRTLKDLLKRGSEYYKGLNHEP